MHTAHLIGFVLFVIAAVVAAFDRAWAVSLIGAGLAVLSAPAAF